MANKPTPQDHKPKEEKAKSSRTTGSFRLSPDLEERDIEGWEIEFDGLTLFLPEESLADYQLQENMANMRAEGRAGAWRHPIVTERMFGVEQKNKLIEHCTDPKTGRADNERVGAFIQAAFKAANPNG